MLENLRMPLRLFTVDGQSQARTPYESYPYDQVTVAMEPGIPYTVRVNLIADDSRPEYQLPRDLLISHAVDDRRLITMSGYSDGLLGPGHSVDVHAWKDRYYSAEDVERDSEFGAIQVVRQIDMVHVEGYENAVEHHRARVEGVDLNEISLEEGAAIHRAMINVIPKGY